MEIASLLGFLSFWICHKHYTLLNKKKLLYKSKLDTDQLPLEIFQKNKNTKLIWPISQVNASLRAKANNTSELKANWKTQTQNFLKIITLSVQ